MLEVKTPEEVLRLIEKEFKPLGQTESVPLSAAMGRVLSEPITAQEYVPDFDRSTVDGYACRAADTFGCSDAIPAILNLAGEVLMGQGADFALSRDSCAYVPTGGAIPKGADCAVMIEYTEDYGDGTVGIMKPGAPGMNLIFRGDDVFPGKEILPAGRVLTAQDIGALAAIGRISVPVARRVKVGVISTGDELVPNTVRPLPKGKIYSSNEAVLAARLQELGIEITTVQGEFSDDPNALADAIGQAAKDADVILTTGGVSVGAKDILHETLPLLNAERIFWRVRLKPGTPLMFSLFEGKPILSLSGNPFAASATFELFARPLLGKLAGCADLEARIVEATLATPFEKFGRGRRFVRAVLENGRVTLPKGHSSGQLASSVGTNCLAEIPPSDAPIEAGAMVRVWML